MEVHLSPETEARLNSMAAETGRTPEQLVQDATTTYLQELSVVRETLDSRYDDVIQGRVHPIDGEQSFARLQRKSKDRRSGRA